MYIKMAARFNTGSHFYGVLRVFTTHLNGYLFAPVFLPPRSAP